MSGMVAVVIQDAADQDLARAVVAVARGVCVDHVFRDG